MKKINRFFLMGAIALSGAVAFTACSSDEELVQEEVNPTFDGQTVKTDFAINIPYSQQAKTRMTGTITQENSNFRGMKNIFLIPSAFQVEDNNNGVDFNHVLLNLGDLGSTSISQDKSSHIYTDQNIAVGTTNFLFYGEAGEGNAPSSKAEKFSNGILSHSIVDNGFANIKKTTDIHMELNQVLEESEYNSYEASKTALLAILNNVVAATNGTKAWSSLPGTPDNSAVDLDEDQRWLGLTELYNEFIRVRADQVRAGSASSIQETMRMLYDYVWLINSKSLDSDVKGLCADIISRIEANFTATANTGWEENDAEATAPGFTTRHFELAWKDAVDEKVKNFPQYYGLPEGVAQLRWNTSEKKFIYQDNDAIAFHADTDGSADDRIDVVKISYPASLQYFVNTPLKATNYVIEESTTSGTSAAPGYWPNTTSDWDSDAYWNSSTTGWIGVVRANTRSIALRNNIHYGVARLATSVKCNAATLKDNAKAKNIVSGEDNGGAIEDQDIAVPTDGFTLTGILIGGQPYQLGWNFLPASTAAGYSNNTDMDYVIYDKVMNGTIAAKSAAFSDPNYTLVLDNYDANELQKVNVALEFVNTSTDFWGVDGVVRAGQKFYLVGQLDATGKTLETAWPTGTYADRFPGNGTARVFIQDYTTTANFTIKDLKNAYVTIPDLRVAKLQLGISVDLKWSKGYTMNIDL